jgi:hypothetical protein
MFDDDVNARHLEGQSGDDGGAWDPSPRMLSKGMKAT